jgi:leucyl/phenylalanyl-tRNA--protein transferase
MSALFSTEDINTRMLSWAYERGIFPWPQQESEVLWCRPEARGVLDFVEFRVPRSLRRELRKTPYTWTWNSCFEEVLRGCQEARRTGQVGTWITDKIVPAYVQFHRESRAHSLEVWRDGALVGGLYGVGWGRYFAGESMFFRESGASKFALVKTVELLTEKGLTWMDVQMVTPVTALFGAKYVSNEEFQQRLIRDLAPAPTR